MEPSVFSAVHGSLYITRCCRDDEVAEIFHSSFSRVQFYSYTDSDEVSDCMQGLRSLMAVERLDALDKCISLFDVGLEDEMRMRVLRKD